MWVGLIQSGEGLTKKKKKKKRPTCPEEEGILSADGIQTQTVTSAFLYVSGLMSYKADSGFAHLHPLL